ncbi:MAG TPA: glycosyltransferase family 1 protein [Rudaea sp.]|jgi:glycosyltransferase involved in cell wall biosynthesis
MRVAIVTETYSPEINGVALTVAGLAHGLAEAGHTVQLIRPRQHSDAAVPVAEGGVEIKLVRGMRLPRYPGLQFGLPAAQRLRALWRQQRPDAIYVATEGPLGWSALRAARALGIPASTGFHTRFDAFMRHYGLGALTPVVFAWLRCFHRIGAATFVPTVELADFLAGRGFGNVVRLPRAVDTALFHPERRDVSLRAQWGIARDQLAVIYVGRIAAEKNLPLAVRSFRAIQKLAPTARYVWVGDGPARAALAAQNPDFIFAGVQRGDELARHYASADLFVFPSLTETFGNVTLEALASGLPTVAFDYGAARERLTEACGRRVAVGDEDAFVDAACDLAARHDRHARTAARAAVVSLDQQTVTTGFIAALAALGNRPGCNNAKAATIGTATQNTGTSTTDVRILRSTP